MSLMLLLQRSFMETHQISLNQIKIEGKFITVFGFSCHLSTPSGLLKSDIHFEIHHIHFKLENILEHHSSLSLSV